MRKRRKQAAIEALEQRRLLSGSVTIISYYGDAAASTPTNYDVGIDGAIVSGTPVAGQTLSVTPEIFVSTTTTFDDWSVQAALSSDSNWGGADDIPLGTVFTNHSNTYGSVAIPENVTPGEYYLLLQLTPSDESGEPVDTNPNDNIFNAGLISVQAAGTANPAPVVDDVAMVGGTLDQSTAAAGAFVQVVPQALRSGAFVADDANVQVVLSTDGVFGNGDDIPLINPNAPVPSQNDPTDGESGVSGSTLNYNGSTNEDDWALYNPGVTDAGGSGLLIMSGNGEEQGSQISVPSGDYTGWNTFHAGEMQIPTTVPAGTYQVLMQVSPYDGPNTTVAAENNPGDDVFDAGTLTVTPYVAPSIQLTQTTFPSTTPAGNSQIDVEPTVVENGVLANLDYNVSVALSTTGSWYGATQLTTDNSVDDYPNHGGEFQISDLFTGPGTYQLLVQVTPLIGTWDNYLYSAINGVNETFDLGTITLTPSDAANFGITTATAPTTVAAGSSVEIDPTIVRTGQSSNDPYQVGVTLSSDDTFGDSNDISLTQLNWSTAQGEDVANPDTTFQVPETLAPGTYELFVNVAPFSGYSWIPQDTDPSDNVLDVGQITVTPDETPDMGVVAATVTPKNVFPGSTIDVQPTIFRSGALADADYQINVALSRDDVWNSPYNIPLGSIDDTATSGEFNIPSTASYGSYDVLVNISPVDNSQGQGDPLPADGNPSDDMLIAGYVIINEPPADDAVTGATFPPTSAAGSNINVEPTVVQQGALAGTSYEINVALSTSGIWGDSNNYTLGGMNLGNGSVEYMAGGPPYTGGDIGIPSDVPAGQYQLLVQIQPYNSPYSNILWNSNPLPTDTNPSDDESDAGSITITGYTPPVWPITYPTQTSATGDDSVTSATFPATAPAGTDIDVEPTVSRTGGLANVDYNISVQLSTSGVWGDSGNITLNPDSSGLVSVFENSFHSGNVLIPSDVPAGDYQLLVEVQPYQSVFNVSQAAPVDTDPNNDVLNAGTISVTPYVAPDDGVTGATFPSSAAAGSNIDVEPTVVQQGALAGTGYQITVELSTSGVWGDASNYQLSAPFLADGSELYSSLPYTGGNIGIPSDVTPGNYQLLVQIQPFSFLSTFNNPLPTDSNPSNDEVDAGMITITPYVQTINPINPIGPIDPINPILPPITVPPVTTLPVSSLPTSASLEVGAGGMFQYANSSNTKFTAVYLSSDSTLSLSHGASRKLLKIGATLSVADPDTKLKLLPNNSAMVPATVPAGTYNILAVTKGNSDIENLGTVIVDAASSQLQATVRPKGKSAKAGGSAEINLTLKNTGWAATTDTSVQLYVSTDVNYSNDDVLLTTQGLTAITLASKAKMSGSYLADLPSSLAAGNYYVLACTNVNGVIDLIGASAKPIAITQ